MSFCERKIKIKLSSGQKSAIPYVIRNIIPSRIVAQYLTYCEEEGVTKGFKPLASSSLFAILSKCGASTRKSLADLDNFSCDGSTSFDRLRDLCDEMATYGEHLDSFWHIHFCNKHSFLSIRNKTGNNCSSETAAPRWL